MTPFTGRETEVWRCQRVSPGTHTSRRGGGCWALVGRTCALSSQHTARPGSLLPARSFRVVPGEEMGGRGNQDSFTSHAVCFLKSQGSCNFPSCRFPTWRISDSEVGAPPARPWGG